MMQKLTRAGNGVLSAASQQQQQQQQVQQQQQQQLLLRMRQQAHNQSSARMPTKRRANGEPASQQQRAYKNDSILNGLQSSYALAQATRSSRSAGSDTVQRSDAAAGRGGNSTVGVVTRNAANGRISGTQSSQSSRFPRLGGAAK